MIPTRQPYLAHDVEHNRLQVLVTVGTDTQVQLAGVGAGLEGLGDAENRVRGSLRDVREAAGGPHRHDRGPATACTDGRSRRLHAYIACRCCGEDDQSIVDRQGEACHSILKGPTFFW